MSPAVRDDLSAIFQQSNQAIIGIPSVTGGSINQCFKVQVTGGVNWFCKTNTKSGLPGLFEKEKNGIEMIARSRTIAVPGNIITGETSGEQWILMEWIEEGEATVTFWENFGAALAAMHHKVTESFGFEEDNYMGALHQSNTVHSKWEEFFREERLLPQVKLARDKGLLNEKEIKVFDRICQRLPLLFSEEKPCLVHGDCWSGNFICSMNGQAVLIDPAVYYGNRQVDLAMSTLFGGFDDVFYQAYAYHFPFPPNYKEQWRILNLYPLLIHLNLFGKSYLSSILGTIAAY